MSKVSSRLKMMRKSMEKVDHSSKLKTHIPAGMAAPNPPLGPQLGQRNINIAAFCKEFNERTAHLKEGIPLPCRIKVNPDRTFDLVIHKPPAMYYLKQAAGIMKGSMYSSKETAGYITLKHLYEIGKIKSEDHSLQLMSLQQICQMLVGVARSAGIEVVRNLEVDEYTQFLKDRELVVAEQRKALEEAREAKLLRTS